MRIRKTVFTTALATTVLALILAGVPGVAFGLQVLIGQVDTSKLPSTEPKNIVDIYNALVPGTVSQSGQIVGDDCVIQSGQTSCPVQPVSINPSVSSLFTISTGGTANATKTAGSINKVTLNNLTIQAQTSGVTVAAIFFHWFTGVNTTVLRAYGQAASGSLCRPDVNNNCQTAVNDSVRLNSAVIYAKTNANLSDPVGCLNTSQCSISFLPQSQGAGPYKVSAGGVANNNYFPESTLPTTTQTAQCTLGGCQNVELIASALTFTFTTAKDAVIQKATHLNASGPNLGVVENTIHAEAVEIDIQPYYNPNNQDINLSTNGNRAVALLSQKQGSTVIFDPNTVDLTSVGMPNHDLNHPCVSPCFAVGDGERVAPATVSFPGDLNGDGEPDLVFTFSIPDIGPNASPPGTCTTEGFDVGVGVLTGTADFTSVTSTSTQQKKPNTGVPPTTCTPPTTDPSGTTTTTCTSCTLDTGGKTMTCITTTTVISQDFPFSGQQTFTCAPKAG